MTMPQSSSSLVTVVFACALAACGGSNFDVASPGDDAATDASGDVATSDASSDGAIDSSRVDASDTSGIPGDVDTGAPSDSAIGDAPTDTAACDWKKTCCAGPGAKPGTCCLGYFTLHCAETGHRQYVCAKGDDFDRAAAKCRLVPELDATQTIWCCDG